MFIRTILNKSQSLLEIAHFCGVAPCTILAANRCRESELFGREINLPISTPNMVRSLPPFFYKATEHDTAASIASKFCIPKNLSASIRQGNIIRIECLGRCEHIVKPMQTLEDIAAQYKTTADKIKAFNNIDVCFLGQRILIP